MTETIDRQPMFAFDAFDELDYLIDLDGHVIFDLYQQREGRGPGEVDLAQLGEKVDGSLLVEGAVDDEDGEGGVGESGQ